MKILLKNKEGKYLLVRRNPKKYPEVGAKWDIVGGRIEPGSSLIENLKREIKEEVGAGIPRESAVNISAEYPEDRRAACGQTHLCWRN